MRIDWMPPMGVSIVPQWLINPTPKRVRRYRARPVYKAVLAYDNSVLDYIREHSPIAITAIVKAMPRSVDSTKSSVGRLLDSGSIYVVGFIPGATATARKQRVFAVTKKE